MLNKGQSTFHVQAVAKLHAAVWAPQRPSTPTGLGWSETHKPLCLRGTAGRR
jgi:hypothetical protein